MTEPSLGKWVVCKAYDDRDLVALTYPVSLGYPRGRGSFRGNIGAFEALSKWLLHVGIKCVAGPVLSGAQMAYVLSLMTGDAIRAVYLPKDGYRPIKHGGGLTISAPYVLVDDVIESGKTMWEAAQQGYNSVEVWPEALVASSWPRHDNLGRLAQFSDRMWVVRPKEESDG